MIILFACLWFHTCRFKDIKYGGLYLETHQYSPLHHHSCCPRQLKTLPAKHLAPQLELTSRNCPKQHLLATLATVQLLHAHGVLTHTHYNQKHHQNLDLYREKTRFIFEMTFVGSNSPTQPRLLLATCALTQTLYLTSQLSIHVHILVAQLMLHLILHRMEILIYIHLMKKWLIQLNTCNLRAGSFLMESPPNVTKMSPALSVIQTLTLLNKTAHL